MALLLFIILNISIFIFLEYINVNSKKFLNLNGMNLIFSFINVILSNNIKPLEKLFATGLYMKYKADFYVIYFVSQHNKIIGSIVIPGIHFGPFRRLGSSSFSGDIIKKFMEKNIPTLVLHRASTHEYDAISSQEMSLVIESLLKKILKREGDSIKISLFKRSFLNGFSCLYQYLGSNFLLAIVSSEKYGIDDIPIEIEKEIASFLHKNILIIDAHNGMPNPSLSPSLSNELRQNIRELIKRSALNTYNEPKYDTIYVGFSTLLNLNKYSEKEIASGGISTLIIKDLNNEKSYFLVAIDSNNMMTGLRDKLKKYFIEKYGFDDGEIVTTDTHEIAGIIPKIYYYPLGENTPYIIIRKNIETCMEKAFSNIYKCNTYLIEYKREIKILGEENLKKINIFVTKYIWKSIIFLSILLSLPILLSLII